MKVMRSIRYKDLLTHSIAVDHADLSSKVDVLIRQVGSGFEIDSIEYGPIYVANATYEFLKLDQDSIPKTLLERFKRHVEFYALQKAAAALDHEWEYEESEAV